MYTRRQYLYAAVLGFLCVELFACPKINPDLSNRSCVNENDCLENYSCHPVRNVCVPEQVVDCAADGAICPDTIETGDRCFIEGAYIPCSSSYLGCERGCRDCVAGAWTACAQSLCTLGEVENCNFCGDNCKTTVRNASPVCVQSAPNIFTCSYIGACLSNAVDTNADKSDGCECAPTGNEICDGIDNDCDGETDIPSQESNAGLCAVSEVCADAACIACDINDPALCGSSCELCSGREPLCNVDRCVCTTTPDSCGVGEYCGDSEQCVPCDTDARCGPSCFTCDWGLSCVTGNCLCIESSCSAPNYCMSDGGPCAPCGNTDAAHCGASCLECSGGTPVCVGGACRCAQGSCAPGSYCAPSGACAPCGCPGLFAACVDTGDNFTCTCNSADSCSDGLGVCENNTTCVFSDAFEAAPTRTSLLMKCTASTVWAWGEAPNCAAGNCWATGLAVDYGETEDACIHSRIFDLEGVRGDISLSLDLYYQYEWSNGVAYDGATLFFESPGSLPGEPNTIFVDPSTGWDTTAPGGLSETIPAWDQSRQGSTAATTVSPTFTLTYAADAVLYTQGFRFVIRHFSDSTAVADGMYVDNIVLKINK